MKRYRIDEVITDFFQKYMFQICIGALLLFSVLMRVCLAPQTISGDYNVTLLSWINEYKSLSFWGGLERTIGNYYVPYNIFLDFVARIPGEPWLWIAITSCAAEYIGAYYLYKLLMLVAGINDSQTQKKAVVVSVSVLFLPVAIMNGALWKQCDAIYTAFIIAGLYYYFSDRTRRALILIAIGFTFKLQIIFIIPFFIIMYFVKKNYSVLQFVWIPVMYVVAGIPCVMAQRGIRETYSVYLRQNSGYNEMTWLSNSLYRLGFTSYDVFGIPAILLAISVFAFALIYVFEHRENITNEKAFILAGWSILTCYLFLPAMHERYDYAGVIIMTAATIMFNRKMIPAVIAINLCSMLVYNYYLFDFDIINGVPFVAVSVIYLAAYFAISIDIISKLKQSE
ncbi:MAG: hypothetical protein J6O61_15825 [Butyrivibrio sp.]|uniref:hypothetical protein n=1 Tax=Butyrivibrio sp. TaxID=28121 RepID=UPI001AFD7A3B|nr:hypothetical protein [Butyrivibrio sp.]MBO6242272.1 hypothetical protein [Butyrivibrio sp.]